MQESYAVGGMHCQGCAGKIETALGAYGETVAVDFPSATLLMTGSTATLEQLNDHVAKAGPYTLSAKPASGGISIGVQQPSAQIGGVAQYYPLLLILAYLTIGSLANAAAAADWMRHFMAGFFLVFSFFKLLNIREFASSYAMYDLLAARWRGYGLLYPFIELGLGVAYLFAWAMQPILWLTLALSLFSGIGVVRSMMRRQMIRCACLGAVLNLPVSTVTLVEDFGMAAMAIFMLASIH